MFVTTEFYGRGLSALCPTSSIVTLAFNCKLTLLGNHPNFVGAAVFLFSCDWFWIFAFLFTSIWRTAEDHTYCGLYSSTCSAWVAFQMVNSAIHQINLCPADNAVDFRNIYPLGSDFSGGKRNQTGARSLRPSRLTSLGHWADSATERQRQFTTARANQTTGLTNGRAANWVPEVVFSPFCALSRRQLTFPSCC